jgi:acyl carrier protein
MEERILKAVYDAIDGLNAQLPPGVSVEKSLDAPLYGASGKLESLDFVTLVMEVEEKIKTEFGVDITIADEHLLSKEQSPFSSVRTLVEYLKEVLEQEASTAS